MNITIRLNTLKKEDIKLTCEYLEFFFLLMFRVYIYWYASVCYAGPSSCAWQLVTLETCDFNTPQTLTNLWTATISTTFAATVSPAILSLSFKVVENKDIAILGFVWVLNVA